MARKPKILTARFEQVLVYSDGPQVILLSGPAESKLVAVAIHKEGMTNPFFAAQVSGDQFRDYIAERFDLRYLLVRPDFKRHFLFDLADLVDGSIGMTRHTLVESDDEDFLPDQGIFSRDHTESVSVQIAAPQVFETFGIDGKWDLPEFSKFYSQVTDLYALFNSVDVFLDQQASLDQKRRVQDAFVKPFEGGGSYVSLYDSLASAHPRSNRLRVDGMMYNSPGFVRVSGRPKPLSEIREMLTHMESNYSDISDDYKSLYKFLSEHKFLRMPAARFSSSNPLAAEIKTRSQKLASSLDAVGYNDVLKMADGNNLVAAKVILSIYRRAVRLYEFFLEGRASYDVASSQT